MFFFFTYYLYICTLHALQYQGLIKKGITGSNAMRILALLM